MRSFSKFLAVAVGLGCAASLAFAADQSILGKSFTVKQKPGGGTPTSRKITGSGKEKGSSDTLVGNPTLSGSAGGAILQVFANGASSTAQTFTLPQGTSSTGKQFWSASGTGFKYKDPKGDQGAVKSVSIKLSPSGSFSIKVKIAGKNGPVNVVPPNPGATGCLALKLGQAAGAGDRYSVDFGVTSQIKNSARQALQGEEADRRGHLPDRDAHDDHEHQHLGDPDHHDELLHRRGSDDHDLDHPVRFAQPRLPGRFSRSSRLTLPENGEAV